MLQHLTAKNFQHNHLPYPIHHPHFIQSSDCDLQHRSVHTTSAAVFSFSNNFFLPNSFLIIHQKYKYITPSSIKSETLLTYSPTILVNGSTEAESIDLYEILGIESGATKVEIKKAYHKVLSPPPHRIFRPIRYKHRFEAPNSRVLTELFPPPQAALSSHPDKVPEHEREEAENRFKNVSQAYEILSDGLFPAASS